MRLICVDRHLDADKIQKHRKQKEPDSPEDEAAASIPVVNQGMLNHASF